MPEPRRNEVFGWCGLILLIQDPALALQSLINSLVQRFYIPNLDLEELYMYGGVKIAIDINLPTRLLHINES